MTDMKRFVIISCWNQGEGLYSNMIISEEEFSSEGFYYKDYCPTSFYNNWVLSHSKRWESSYAKKTGLIGIRYFEDFQEALKISKILKKFDGCENCLYREEAGFLDHDKSSPCRVCRAESDYVYRIMDAHFIHPLDNL